MEQEHSEPLELLTSDGAGDFAGEPAPDSSPEPDSDDPELLEPDALPNPELEPEEDELILELWEQHPGDGDFNGL